MKWVICAFCKAQYCLNEDEKIEDLEACEICGHREWKEEK